MKKVFNILVLTLAIALFQSPTLFAQKYGYLNLNNLLEEMPAAKAANSTLETYQKKFEEDITVKATAFQERYMAILKEVESGTLSQIQIQQKEAELKQEQEALKKMESDAQLKIMQRREELLAPILQSLEEAVNAVAEENGYNVIFNESVFNALLYVDEANNVAPLVKKKLGI